MNRSDSAHSSWKGLTPEQRRERTAPAARAARRAAILRRAEIARSLLASLGYVIVVDHDVREEHINKILDK